MSIKLDRILKFNTTPAALSARTKEMQRDGKNYQERNEHVPASLTPGRSFSGQTFRQIKPA